MRRTIRYLMLLLCLTVCLTASASAMTVDSIAADCSVEKNGTATVTLSVSVMLDGTEESVMIPLSENSVQGISVSGHKYKKTDGDGYVGVELTDLKGTVGAQTVSVSFSTEGTQTQTDDGQVQFTAPLLCAHWAYPATACTFTVRMPAEFTAEPVAVSGYYGTLSSDACTMSVDSTTISGTLSAPLKDHEALSVSLTLPDGYFTGGRTASDRAVRVGALAIILLMGVLCTVYWVRCLRNRSLTVRRCAMPPEGVCAGDVPMLLDGSDPLPGWMIAHWAELGYLEIYARRHGRATIYRRMAMGNERREYETALFERLFLEGDVCETTSRAYRAACAASVKPARKDWNRRLFDKTGGNLRLLRMLAAAACAVALSACMHILLPAGVGFRLVALACLLPGGFAGLRIQDAVLTLRKRSFNRRVLMTGGVGLLVILIISGISGDIGITLLALLLQGFAGWSTAYGGRRTQAGCEMLEQLLGLREFLTGAPPEELQAMAAQDSQYFCTMLPYAEVLGVGEAFTARFGKQKLEPPDWLDSGDDRGALLSAGEMRSRLCAVLREL